MLLPEFRDGHTEGMTFHHHAVRKPGNHASRAIIRSDLIGTGL
jgi:hypothetical protein